MNEKKIEPTQAMVEAGASYAWEETNPGILGWNSISERHKEGCRRDARAVLTAALNHYDAPGLFADEDDRPWEPLAPGDPLHAGDEVWRWWCGVSTRGTFDVQHPDSQVYTAERGHLGHRAIGTWYVRRAIQELPTEDGVEIVPAGGGPIGAAHPGGKFTTHHATYDSYLGSWVGVWRAASGRVTVSSVSPGDITPGTWKVEGE